MKRNNNEAKNVAKANTNMADNSNSNVWEALDHLTPFDTKPATGG